MGQYWICLECRRRHSLTSSYPRGGVGRIEVCDYCGERTGCTTTRIDPPNNDRDTWTLDDYVQSLRPPSLPEWESGLWKPKGL